MLYVTSSISCGCMTVVLWTTLVLSDHPVAICGVRRNLTLFPLTQDLPIPAPALGAPPLGEHHLSLQVVHPVVDTNAGVVLYQVQTIHDIVLVHLLLLWSTLLAIPHCARPAGAVEAAQGVGAVSKDGAWPVLALIQVMVSALFSSPAIITVTLKHKPNI